MTRLYAYAPPEPDVSLRRFSFRGVASIVAAVSLGVFTISAPASSAEATARAESTAIATTAGPADTVNPSMPSTDPTDGPTPTGGETPTGGPSPTDGPTQLPAAAGPDLAAIGAHVRAGNDITVRVGIVNRGPTTMRAGAWKWASVQFAEIWGADILSRVRSHPAGCRFVPESMPPIPLPPNWIPDVFVSYWSCRTDAEIKVGQTFWFDFTGAFQPTRGHIEIGSADGRDRNPANDRADVVVSATGPTTATARPPVAPGLPATGERTGARVAALAGLGAALLATGAAVIWLVRRRPDRVRRMRGRA